MTTGSEEAWWEEVDAVCITLLDGLSPTNALRVLRGRNTSRLGSRAKSDDWVFDRHTYDGVWLAVGTQGRWTWIWEDNGFWGCQPEKMTELSADGTAISMYWNVNALMSFVFARDGVIVSDFDPLLSDAEDRDLVNLVTQDVALSLEAGWDVDVTGSGLALQAMLAGLTDGPDPSWLSRPGVTFWKSSLLSG